MVPEARSTQGPAKVSRNAHSGKAVHAFQLSMHPKKKYPLLVFIYVLFLTPSLSPPSPPQDTERGPNHPFSSQMAGSCELHPGLPHERPLLPARVHISRKLEPK